jgi:hypothetical protein
LLVGTGAPAATQSPIRLAFGARYHVGAALQLGLTATACPSARPAQSTSDRLLPIEPRLMLQAGLAYAFDAGHAQVRDVDANAAVPIEAAPITGDVHGRLLDSAGEPIAGARVRVSSGALVQETQSDAGGNYRFRGIPAGDAQLVAEREGYEPRTWRAALSPGGAALPEQRLVAHVRGELRGLVLSFAGRPVAARVVVSALDAVAGDAPRELSAGMDGRFQLDAPPGRYEVIVSAPGFASQTRSVQVVGDGVVILNVDLRKAAP